MAYTLTDLLATQSNAPVNGVGLATKSSVLWNVRSSLRDEIDEKFVSGEPATIPSSASRGYKDLNEIARRQATVEGILLEHGVVGTTVHDAITRAALKTQTSPAYVQSIAETLAHDGGLDLTGKTLRIPGVETPELDPSLATRLVDHLRMGVCDISLIDRDVSKTRAALRGHPFIRTVEHQGIAYAVFEDSASRDAWMPADIVHYTLELQNQTATEAALITIFTGEPRFPREYLAAPDFVPDHIWNAAGELHDAATRRRMLIRSRDHRVSLLGERVVSTYFGRPLSCAAVQDYDAIEDNSPAKKPDNVWETHRRVLLQGTALEILGKQNDEAFDIAQAVDALVDIAAGPERYDAERIRRRLRGRTLSDAALNRVMTLAGRQGLMGTSLASHYRLYANEAGGE